MVSIDEPGDLDSRSSYPEFVGRVTDRRHTAIDALDAKALSTQRAPPQVRAIADLDRWWI